MGLALHSAIPLIPKVSSVVVVDEDELVRQSDRWWMMATMALDKVEQLLYI